MKKDDLTKRLSGEKIDLKIELSKFSFCLFFLYLTGDINPQIPINGFCKLTSYQFVSGYTEFISFNFNNDSYSDLLFFNPSVRNILTAAGQKNEKFAAYKKFEFPFAISNVNPIRGKNNRIINYAFTARKDLAAGICQFSADGKPKATYQIKFNSYPQNISSSNVDAEGLQEILISGPAFEGLSLISLSGKELHESKIQSKSSYSDAIFVDLSNDQYPDIAALNVMNNSLEFFFNNGRGNFKLVRTIELSNKSFDLNAFDMNLDSYQDLIFFEGNKIKIFYGDFASSYSNQVEISTSFTPSELILGDFNKDGAIDISYLASKDNIVSTFFALDENSFYDELVLLRTEKAKSIIPFYSKFIDGLAVLCQDGKVLTITRSISLAADYDLSIGIRPKCVNYFDAYSDGVNDLCLLDEYDNCLKLIVRNSEGVPTDFYSVKLLGEHNKIEPKNFSKQSTSFFCYSLGNKLVEEIVIEFNSGKIYRSEFYSSRAITDLKAFQDEKNKVFVTSLNNKRLTVEIYEKSDDWILLTDFNISEKAVNSYISSSKELNLYFWNHDDDSLKLFCKTFHPKEFKANLLSGISMKDVKSVFTIADDFMNTEKESVISFVESNEKAYILVSNERTISTFNLKTLNKKLQILNQNQLFSSEINENTARKIFVNDLSNHSIGFFSILRKGKQVMFSELKSPIRTSSYFIKNLGVSDYHLVFINNQKACISIRQI
ncbi:MAG: VCBS repeat-containing protein [Ignavibacteriaceae bacterium]|nr:VCBS repeat-containing protein [Ignavibacteriaceae bacterium]